MSKSAKIWLSESIFYVKNYPNLSQIYFHWRISIQEHIFCHWHFLITSIFKSLYFVKRCPIFDTSTLTQFSKFKFFLWVCCFLGKIFLILYPPFENSTTGIAIPGSQDGSEGKSYKHWWMQYSTLYLLILRNIVQFKIQVNFILIDTNCSFVFSKELYLLHTL